MKKLTLNAVVERFNKLYPFGSITKQSNNKYDVFFDARDFRTEAEKELDLWGTTADKRKMYTYSVSSLKQLAYKLKIDVSDFEVKSKVNEEWERWLASSEDENIDLFGE